MKKVLKILAVVLLIAAAGVGGFFLGGRGKAPTAPQAEAPAAEQKAAEAPPAAAAKPAAGKAEASAPRKIEPIKPADWPAFSIELANFRDAAAAGDYAAEMRRRNLPVEVVETVDEGGRPWYHVRFGKFADPRQAAARLPDVQRMAGIYGVVTAELPARTAAAAPAATASQ